MLLINFLGQSLTGYLSNNQVERAIQKHLTYWMPYLLGVSKFSSQDIKYATQSKLDIINYIGIDRINIQRGGESKFI